MEDRIIVDFNALDRIANKLNTAGNELDAALSILSGAYPAKINGGELRLNGANIALRSVEGTVSAYNVAQAVLSYRSALNRVSSYSRKLSSAVSRVSSEFCDAEAESNRGVSSVGDYLSQADELEKKRKEERASGWGMGPGTITAVEYALLSQYCNDSTGKKRTEQEIAEEFIKKLKNFPEGHPLNTLYNNLYVKKPPDTGFGTVEGKKMGTFSDMEAVVIKLADGHAIVFFAGTDVSNGPQDIIADVGLAASAIGHPLQQIATDILFESEFEAANRLIRELEKEGFEHISVTGHSLGGHLAADVALHNKCIDECVTFDPPGRGDTLFHEILNSEQTDKITNYIANGSIVHVPGTQPGNTIRVSVEFNTDAVVPNHSISKIADSLGGMEKVHNDWL